jgi:hypothetical protein
MIIDLIKSQGQPDLNNIPDTIENYHIRRIYNAINDEASALESLELSNKLYTNDLDKFKLTYENPEYKLTPDTVLLWMDFAPKSIKTVVNFPPHDAVTDYINSL